MAVHVDTMGTAWLLPCAGRLLLPPVLPASHPSVLTCITPNALPAIACPAVCLFAQHSWSCSDLHTALVPSWCRLCVSITDYGIRVLAMPSGQLLLNLNIHTSEPLLIAGQLACSLPARPQLDPMPSGLLCHVPLPTRLPWRAAPSEAWRPAEPALLTRI